MVVYRRLDKTHAIRLIDPFTVRRFSLPPFTDSSRTYKQQEELRTELISSRRWACSGRRSSLPDAGWAPSP